MPLPPFDHANSRMVSKETGDVLYSTNEPQIAFNSRFAFCFNMHKEAVKALKSPPTLTRKRNALRRGARGSTRRDDDDLV